MSDNRHYYCAILAGGIGSRFWPISRESMPKQFLDFTNAGKSFLRLTYDRMKAIVPEENIIIVSLERYRDLVTEHIPELPAENLLLEEYNRNTAPSVAYATYSVLRRDPEAVMVVTPSDHVIGDEALFTSTVLNSLRHAERSDALITLGIMPTRPDPNFGYIQAVGDFYDSHHIKVKTFVEKPSEELAQVFIDTGEFLWNSGIFIWKASVIRGELEKYAPEITKLWAGWEEALGTPEERGFVQRIYASDLPRIAIDYAVMEKTDKAWVYPAKFSWADIGNWNSLYDYLSHHDSDGNANNFKGKSLLRNCRDNIIYSDRGNKLTAIRGLEDFVVIDTDDVLFICPRADKDFNSLLSELAMPEYKEFK